jgi:hypothetical protein
VRSYNIPTIGDKPPGTIPWPGIGIMLPVVDVWSDGVIPGGAMFVCAIGECAVMRFISIWRNVASDVFMMLIIRVATTSGW